MTIQKIQEEAVKIYKPEDEYNIPLDISDIIYICQEYNKLGAQLQYQLEKILENGLEESITANIVKKESLPYIKDFLISVNKNPYFGDASDQAQDMINVINILIKNYKNMMLN